MISLLRPPIRLLGLGLLVVSLARPAAGQLTLDAFSPADGATDVNTTTTVELTFSAAIDATAEFEVTDGFFLGFELLPDPGMPLDVRVSPDGQTIALDYALDDDTRYQALLTAALSTSGDPLDRPVAFAFSTGSTLPTGSVSGTVSFPGGDPDGALVGLFADTGTFLDDDVSVATVVDGSSGAYTIPFVPAGTYFAASIKDIDGDQNIDAEMGDAFTLYDADGDRIIDRLTVDEGQAVAGIDLSLGALESNTAGTTFPAAQQAATAVSSDAALIAAFGEGSPEGEAVIWGYLFYDAVAEDTVEVVAFGGQLAVAEGFLTDGDDGGPPFDVQLPIVENWIDSDVAAAAAEANGGADYRAGIPGEVTMLMLLVTLDEGSCSLFGKARPATLAVLVKLYWVVVYFPGGLPVQPLVVCVDALTGRVAVEAEPGVPSAFVLAPNFPNPFNPETTIRFGLAVPGPVRLAVYDVQGRHVATLVEGPMPAGNYVVPWRADGLPSGVYLYRLETPTQTLSRTMVLLK